MGALLPKQADLLLKRKGFASTGASPEDVVLAGSEHLVLRTPTDGQPCVALVVRLEMGPDLRAQHFGFNSEGDHRLDLSHRERERG